MAVEVHTGSCRSTGLAWRPDATAGLGEHPPNKQMQIDKKASQTVTSEFIITCTAVFFLEPVSRWRIDI